MLCIAVLRKTSATDEEISRLGEGLIEPLASFYAGTVKKENSLILYHYCILTVVWDIAMGRTNITYNVLSSQGGHYNI